MGEKNVFKIELFTKLNEESKILKINTAVNIRIFIMI